MQIIAKVKITQQGYPTYIPVNDWAKMVVELTNQKNITQSQVQTLKRYGVEVVELREDDVKRK